MKLALWAYNDYYVVDESSRPLRSKYVPRWLSRTRFGHLPYAQVRSVSRSHVVFPSLRLSSERLKLLCPFLILANLNNIKTRPHMLTWLTCIPNKA